jgi:hypothetical protein
MFHEIVEDPGSRPPADLRQRYEMALRDVIEHQGVDAVAEESDVDAATLTALADGESPELSLEEAASILAVQPDTPDGDAIAATSRDALLMGMTTAVLDVEAIESGLEGELEAREIQAKVEGRYPMTVAEFALLQQHIESAV